MKKEVFLAITIGFVLGLIITFGIWTANKSLKNLPQTKTVATATPAPTSGSNKPEPQPTTAASSSSLTITQPIDEALVTTDTVALTGKAAPSSTIVIFSETGEQLISADSAGSFTANVKLEGGYNQIKVTAFDSTGSVSSQTLLVTYTTSKI